MDEDTTTAQDVQATDAEEASSVTPEQSESADVQDVAEPSESQEDGSADEAADESGIDGKLKKFAASQGIELDSPNAIKAAQLALKNQSEASRNSKKANELEKATQITQEQLPDDASAQDAYEARMRNLELKSSVQDWKLNNPDKAQAESQMAQFILDNPAKGELVQKGYLDLNDIYNLSVSNANSATAKSQGKKEALSDLAHKQQAAVPAGNATSRSTPKEKPFADLSIAEMEKRLGIVRA